MPLSTAPEILKLRAKNLANWVSQQRRALWVGSLVLSIITLLTAAEQQTSAAERTYTTPLATGVRLDAAGEVIDLASMPLAIIPAPGGKQVVVVLGGWREQGIQIVDLSSQRVTQTLTQEAAFYGATFSADGKKLYVSGGNEDLIFEYSWHDGTATLLKKIVLGEKKADKTGSRYPAGLAMSRRGNLLYVAESVGDSLAVVDTSSSQVIQRFSTDHYPYAVEAAADGQFMSPPGEEGQFPYFGLAPMALFPMAAVSR